MSDRWSTLNVGAPGCNTTCVSDKWSTLILVLQVATQYMCQAGGALSVGTLSCNTICVSARSSTLNIGILSCNTKCVSRQMELQAATYNVPAVQV